MRKVDFSDAGDFFSEKMLSYVEKTWEQWLGPLVPNLPGFHNVISELQPTLESMLSDKPIF